MTRPRRIAPRARARRALLADSLAAIAFAVLALSLAAGLGVIGFFALPVLVLGLAWIATERLLAPRPRRRPRPSPGGAAGDLDIGDVTKL